MTGAQFIRAPVALLLALLSATPAAEAADYEVEIVVFRQWEARGSDGEAWPEDPPIPQAANLKVVASSDGGRDTSAVARLPKNALRLAGIRDVLARSNDYEVLAHWGWRQRGLSKSAAPEIALPLDWNPPHVGAGLSPFEFVPVGTTLYGTLTVYRERYLHVQTNLRYVPGGVAEPVSPPDPVLMGIVPNIDYSDDILDGDAVLEPQIATFPMKQHRRLRSGEVHYLDHPVLGLIVQVRPAG